MNKNWYLICLTCQMTLPLVHIYDFGAFTQLICAYFLTYCLYHHLYIVHQIIRKIMSSLEIKEFTGDLC